MSEMVSKNCAGKPVLVKTEAGHPCLDTCYPSVEDAAARAKEKYERDRADYFNTCADDPALLRKTKRWQKSAHDYLCWAGTLFNVYKDDNEKRREALDIMDRIVKESGVRHHNMGRYADITMAKAKESDEEQQQEETRDAVNKAESESGSFFRNAVRTQLHYMDLFERGECYTALNHKDEAEAGARAEEMRKKLFPKDHVYIPGRVYPPHPIPEGERVPYEPEPYLLMDEQPVDAYVWDEVSDEYVIRPGYVSEDGLIDDQSVTYDVEAGTCTMKFRGGVPVTWPWWKTRDTREMPTGWALEYLYRVEQQWMADQAMGILKPGPDESADEDVPEYNRIPKNN